MSKARHLRESLAQDKVIYVMGAHSGLSAKLAERCGYDALWASGLEISAAYGVPDANILTMTQYLDKSSELNEAVRIPVISDCDTGYGNSSNVIYMVKKYEAAGIAAVCMEDKLFPKMNSFIPGRQELAPIAEFVGKIMAAKSAQADPDFLVIARTEALIAGWGEEEALLRAGKYLEAGADAILIHSKQKDGREVIRFAEQWNKRAPLVVVPTTYPDIMRRLSDQDLLDLGIRIVIFANQGLRASIKAMSHAMGLMRTSRGTCDLSAEMASLSEVFELQGVSRLKQEEEKYLRTKTADCRAIFLAAGGPQNQEDLAPLLRDRPVALLDLNGQSLIERNIQTLARAGVQDVTVIAGYHAELFQLEGIRLINNPDYERKGIFHSLQTAGDAWTKRSVVLYADVLVDRGLADRLLACEEAIVLVVDESSRKLNLRNKKLDLVETDHAPLNTHRSIEGDRKPRVLRIGSDLPESAAHGEFIGAMLLSEHGIQTMKSVAAELNAAGEDSQLTINDVVQAVIARGHTVNALMVNSGWTEIHTFENYKAACAMLSNK
jgi:phosphoenolpyruvate phosphomutase